MDFVERQQDPRIGNYRRVLTLRGYLGKGDGELPWLQRTGCEGHRRGDIRMLAGSRDVVYLERTGGIIVVFVEGIVPGANRVTTQEYS